MSESKGSDNFARISVYSYGDGKLLSRFGGAGDVGSLNAPCGLSLSADGWHVAVADKTNNRVCVFSSDGALVSAVGRREWKWKGCWWPYPSSLSSLRPLVLSMCLVPLLL